MPRLNGSRSTRAPARRASTAVSSVEPSSTISTSNSGAWRRRSSIVAVIAPASLYAGTMARALVMIGVGAGIRPSEVRRGGRRKVAPARGRLAPRRDRPGPLPAGCDAHRGQPARRGAPVAQLDGARRHDAALDDAAALAQVERERRLLALAAVEDGPDPPDVDLEPGARARLRLGHVELHAVPSADAERR